MDYLLVFMSEMGRQGGKEAARFASCAYPMEGFCPGFLNFSATDLLFFVARGCSVHCGRFSSIPGFYTSEASSPPLPRNHNKNTPQNDQMSHWGTTDLVPTLWLHPSLMLSPLPV